MKAEKIQIEYAYKNGFSSFEVDKICHIKTLPYLSIVQAIEGSYDIQLKDTTTYNTGDGGFFIAPSNIKQTITHHQDIRTNRMICRWVFLKIKINDLYIFDKLFDFPTILPEEYKAELNAIFKNLFSSNDIYDEYICYHQIIKILSLTASHKTSNTNSYVDSAIDIIKKDYREKITVKHLANVLNMSESNFFVIFKKHTGFTPIAYLNNYRLSMASELLVNTDNPVNSISQAVGIDDSIYFNKLFKKTYHMPPTKYREIYKK